ncbi:hypothetical protein GTY75_09160 [Streptomyces sp. SID8381]|uniref:hypothetical protein n=1 Tax=unclassified Streptomyces TaxID=2593676 RepID=UPI0003820885|nr:MULTISPECIES: hypothetical protein [unclassified Streptomyces]MYX26835.1 hypothetical protein [Streptomyces sp. SID8381]
MPAPTAEIRTPSAPAVSRLLGDYADLGLIRSPRAGAVGFTVKTVTKEREKHGGSVIVRWNQPDRGPSEARLIAHGRHTLMRILLEDAGFAVALHHNGYLVLLDPNDVDAHREAEQAAGTLLGDGAEFWREESGALLGDDVPVTIVPRTAAVAEVALALRAGRAPYEQLGTVFMDGDITVTLTPVRDDEREERPESPLGAARRIFRQSGEPVLDDQDAQRGTGVWVRASLVPGEVLVLRKDDGMRASGLGPAARRWERTMEFYRRLLEDAGWAMTGRGDMGWAFRRPTGEDADTRAVKVLGALWPRHKLGQRSGWVLAEAEGATGFVTWRSELADPDRRAVAEMAMLPYLADALRRAGLSTTLPDEVPMPERGTAVGLAVAFAEPPAQRTGPRYSYEERWGEWWVGDTDTFRLRRREPTEEAAEKHAHVDNQDDATNRRLGRVSDGLPGLTSDLAEVPEFRMVAAELAAAGFLPAHRWEDHGRPQDGFLLSLAEKGIEVNHLSTQPDGMHRITRPVDEGQAHAFDTALRGYAEALDAPARIVTLKADHLVVYGAEERRRRPQIPDGQLFDAAVTYRVDCGAPRTAVFTLSPWAVDPYGDGEPQRHRVAESVAAGRDVDRIVIDDVHPFAERGTRRHRAQMAAAEMLVRVLGPGAVWCVEVDWLAATRPEVPRTPEEEGVLMLSVPDNAPAGSVERIRSAAEELGWSSAVLSRSVAWVQVPAGGEAMA